MPVSPNCSVSGGELGSNAIRVPPAGGPHGSLPCTSTSGVKKYSLLGSCTPAKAISISFMSLFEPPCEGLI